MFETKIINFFQSNEFVRDLNKPVGNINHTTENDFHEKIEKFNLAEVYSLLEKNRHLVNILTISKLMKNPHLSFESKKSIFNKIISLKINLLNLSPLYKTYIPEAAKKEEFLEMRRVFEDANTNGVLLNVGTYISCIRFATGVKNFEQGEWIYQQALEDKKCNIKLANSYLNLLGAVNKFNMAREIFNIIVNTGNADITTYFIFLKTAGPKRFELAKNIFETAIAIPRFADKDFFMFYMDIAHKADRFDEVQHAFIKLEEAGFELSPQYYSRYYSLYIISAYKANQINIATEKFKTLTGFDIANYNIFDVLKSHFLVNFIVIQDRLVYFDFRNLSAELLWVFLSLFIIFNRNDDSQQNEKRINLILGQGVQSKDNKSILNPALAFFEEHIKQTGAGKIKFSVNVAPNNPGKSTVSFVNTGTFSYLPVPNISIFNQELNKTAVGDNKVSALPLPTETVQPDAAEENRSKIDDTLQRTHPNPLSPLIKWGRPDELDNVHPTLITGKKRESISFVLLPAKKPKWNESKGVEFLNQLSGRR